VVEVYFYSKSFVPPNTISSLSSRADIIEHNKFQKGHIPGESTPVHFCVTPHFMHTIDIKTRERVCKKWLAWLDVKFSELKPLEEVFLCSPMAKIHLFRVENTGVK
jgi:hypothetical protein